MVTDVQWSKQANDWVPVITIGTGDSAVKYYGIRCPHDGKAARIPQDVIAAEDRCKCRAGGAGGAGCRKGGRSAGRRGETGTAGRRGETSRGEEMRRAGARGGDDRREGETVNAFFVYSCARSLNNIAYTITPYYDDVVGTNTCPAIEMVTDKVLQEVEVVTESSAEWKLQDVEGEPDYGQMVLQTEEKSVKSLEVMPMMQRVSRMSQANNALMRWRIAGPAKGGDAERWQSEMIELRRGKRGTLEAWTLQGRKLTTREALKMLNTLASDYEARARHYEKERERIERDERTALRAAERYARRKGFAKEKEEAAEKIREVAVRRRALEEMHTVVYAPEDPSSERCRKDIAKRLARPGQKVETPDERLERTYRQRLEKAASEAKERREKRRQRTGEKDSREQRDETQRVCPEPEVVWYKPRRAFEGVTAGSLADAVCAYENTGTAPYAQSGSSGPRATPTAQLTKRADTTSNVVNTVTATPWRTEREPGSLYQEVDGDYEAVLPETKDGGRTVDMERAGQVEVTRYALLGEPRVDPDLKRPCRKTGSRDRIKDRSGLRSIKSRKRIAAQEKEDREGDEREKPAEAPDQFTAVRLKTEHASNTNWTLAATALGDKVRKGEITADEANDLSRRYAPTMQGSFMFPVISYPAVQIENGEVTTSVGATRQYIPHLCLGEIGETEEGSDYASTFGDRRVFVDKGSFTSSRIEETGRVEVVPGKQCEIEKDEETGGVSFKFYTKRGTVEKTSVLRMPKRGATWCCSCPYAMTEYANTPYQQTNHSVVTTVNSMPTITMGEDGANLGGTARTEYFMQFVNAGLAMYRIGEGDKFWAAVGTLNLSPSAVSMVSGQWRDGGFTGWSNIDNTTGELLVPSTQAMKDRKMLETQNVVDELKPIKNKNMWECTWNSEDVQDPVRDYSLAELVADAGSFFGTWLETSNGCDMSKFSGNGQALFCSFNIRGGIVANTLVFVGNSFGERMGKGASGGGEDDDEPPEPPETEPMPWVDYIPAFNPVFDCGAEWVNSAIQATVSPLGISANESGEVTVTYRIGRYSTLRVNPDDFIAKFVNTNTIPVNLLTFTREGTQTSTEAGLEYSEIMSVKYSPPESTRVYATLNKWRSWYDFKFGENYGADQASGNTSSVSAADSANVLAAPTSADFDVTKNYGFYHEYDVVPPPGNYPFPVFLSLTEWKNSAGKTNDDQGFELLEPYLDISCTSVRDPYPEDTVKDAKVFLKDAVVDVTIPQQKRRNISIRDACKNSTRQYFRDHQPQRVNAAGRKWIEERKRREAEEEKKEGERKSISIRDACKNSKRHLMRESMPQRMSRAEREYVDALKNGKTPKPKLVLKVEQKNEDLPKIVDGAKMYPDGGFANYEDYKGAPEAENGNGGTIEYTVSNVQTSGDQLSFTMTLSTSFPFNYYDGDDDLQMNVGGSTLPQIQDYLSGYVDGKYGVTDIVSIQEKGNIIIFDKDEGLSYYNTFDIVFQIEQEEPAYNSYGAPVEEITIPARVRGTGKPEDDEPAEGVTIPVSHLVQPILTTSTSLLMQVDQRGLPCRVKRSGVWETDDGNKSGEISLDPNSFSRMSSLRRPHYSQQMTGKWWSLGDVPVTFISESTGYSQIRGGIVGLFTGVIDFFDMEKQVLPASVRVFDRGEREVGIIDSASGGLQQAEIGDTGRTVSQIEDWADPSTNNYEHDGKGVFGRRTAEGPQQFSNNLSQSMQEARTLVSQKDDGARFSFKPPVAPLFFWHVSWSVNFASPVATGDELKVLPTDIPTTVGETYYAKPLFAWTYGVPKTMPNVALMSSIDEEERRYVKIGEDGKEYMDRDMTRAKEGNVVEFMPGMFGAASLLNVGCDASVDLVAYNTGT